MASGERETASYPQRAQRHVCLFITPPTFELQNLGHPVMLSGDPILAKIHEELQKQVASKFLEFLGEIKERDQALLSAGSGRVG